MRRFALYQWGGGAHPPTRLDVNLNGTGLAPEGLLVLDNTLLIASDDDSVSTPRGSNGKLPESERTFRALLLNLEA